MRAGFLHLGLCNRLDFRPIQSSLARLCNRDLPRVFLSLNAMSDKPADSTPVTAVAASAVSASASTSASASIAAAITTSSVGASASTRMLIIESLVPLAVAEVARQLPDFIDRLAQAMFHLSDQTVRPNEAKASLHGRNYLQKNTALFQRNVLASLTSALLAEIASLYNVCSSTDELDQRTLSLVTLDEMENKVLIGIIGQAIELANSSALVGLNSRLSRLLQRSEVRIAQNPFRPTVFLRAVFDAWCKFDPLVDSHRLVLRLFRPEIFVDLAPLLAQLNQDLIARGIVSDLAEVYRHGKASRASPVCPDVERRDASLQNKVHRWLQTTGDEGGQGKIPPGWGATLPGTAAPSGDRASLSSPTPQLISYLADLQQNKWQSMQATNTSGSELAAVILRNIVRDAPAGTLDAQAHAVIELLARVFDFVFSDAGIPSHLKKLLGQLQVPLLKTALIDKEFFYKENHPARRLFDQLAQSGVGMQAQAEADDPLYKTIEQIIDRVQRDFDQQLDLFTDVVADLETFLANQERDAESALKAPIAEALHEEKMQQAQLAAENDIAARIETGEVAGFVEIFLETQWLRVLTLTHSVARRKPKALVSALKAMDDLIWSVKPKVGTDERAELITKLPSILSRINAWLNAIKCDGPERITFFSRLVERHAAIVRNPAELSPRHQLHLAVNVAQKASERRLSRRARELDAAPVDQFVHEVDSLEKGNWIEFVRHNGLNTPFRLVWVSPLRSRFIFCNRQNGEPFSFTADELALALREQGATVLAIDSVSTRALSAALDDLDIETGS